MPSRATLATIRAQIAAVEAGTRNPGGVWRFGEQALDDCFVGGGLALNAWHEIAADGMEAELCAAPAAFAARIATALAAQQPGRGEVVWVMRRDDLYAPGLAHLGFAAERLIQVRAQSEDEVLGVLEEALASRGQLDPDARILRENAAITAWQTQQEAEEAKKKAEAAAKK